MLEQFTKLLTNNQCSDMQVRAQFYRLGAKDAMMALIMLLYRRPALSRQISYELCHG